MKNREEFQIAFAGETISEEKRLWNMINQQGLVKDVVEIGRVSSRELALAYHAASVVVLPSLYEGFGLSILESMAAGIPAIGASSGSIPEIMGDGGILFNPHSVEELQFNIDISGSDMNRIGVFGGTFDPPHKGHIAIAEQARKQLRLDKVIFVPAYIPPHKRLRSSTTASQRLHMVKLAIEGKKAFKVSAIELKRKGISYTIDTLKIFKVRYHNAELILIIGADNFEQFESWKSPEKIIHFATLAIYKRKDQPVKDRKNAIIPIKGRFLDVSSTQIRMRINIGLPIKTLLPEKVKAYIKKNSLYLKGSSDYLRKNHK
jgi:nicotinate-nucleotide adenylyltransferase